MILIYLKRMLFIKPNQMKNYAGFFHTVYYKELDDELENEDQRIRKVVEKNF